MARLRVIAELWDLKDTKEDLGAQIHKGKIYPNEEIFIVLWSMAAFIYNTCTSNSIDS